MSRYFKRNDLSSSDGNQRENSSSQIVLPEFIPFNEDFENKSQYRSSASSSHRDHEQIHEQMHASRYANQNTDHRIQENVNKVPPSRESRRSRHDSKDSYSQRKSSPAYSRHSTPPGLRNDRNKANYERTRSPPQFRTNSPENSPRTRGHSPSQLMRKELLETFDKVRRSPSYGQRNRNRSRSPIVSRNSNPGRSPNFVQRNNDSHNSRNRSPPRHSRIEPPRNERENQIRHEQRNMGRGSSERSRNGSVFDRISSPPPLLRRYGESVVSRRSVESNGSQSHFFRTVQVREDAVFQSYDRSVDDLRPLQTDQNHFQDVARYVGNDSFGVDPRSLVVEVDVSAELRSYRERLIAAETHCIGLETTVRSYEREINKLRVIVESLIDDYKVLQSSIR